MYRNRASKASKQEASTQVRFLRANAWSDALERRSPRWLGDRPGAAVLVITSIDAKGLEREEFR
jgi:hypothetical protein